MSHAQQAQIIRLQPPIPKSRSQKTMSKNSQNSFNNQKSKLNK